MGWLNAQARPVAGPLALAAPGSLGDGRWSLPEPLSGPQRPTVSSCGSEQTVSPQAGAQGPTGFSGALPLPGRSNLGCLVEGRTPSLSFHVVALPPTCLPPLWALGSLRGLGLPGRCLWRTRAWAGPGRASEPHSPGAEGFEGSPLCSRPVRASWAVCCSTSPPRAHTLGGQMVFPHPELNCSSPGSWLMLPPGPRAQLAAPSARRRDPGQVCPPARGRP